MSIKQIFGSLNVLYVSPFSRLGGGEVSLLTLLSGIDRQSCVPHVVCYEEGSFPQRVRELAIPCAIMPRVTLIDEARIVVNLVRFIRAHRISIVHVNSLDIRAVIAARLAGAAVVSHLRVVIPFTWRDACAAGVSHAVIAVSAAVRDMFCRRSRRLRERCAVIPNAVDVSAQAHGIALRTQLGLPADARIIGMAGRLDPLKGHDCFLRAAVLIRRRFPGACFVIAGEGDDPEYERGIRSDIERLGLGSAVFMLGFRQDILAVISQFDVLVVPSLQIQDAGHLLAEGFGRGAIEGMAVGVPVVVSDSGGLPEIVEDKISGRVVAHGDHVALSDAVRDILGDERSAKALAAAGYEAYLKRFTVARHVESVERVYVDALLRSRTPLAVYLKQALVRLYCAVRAPFVWLLDKTLPPCLPKRESVIPARDASARILLIRPDRLGDFVLSLPFIENLRAAYPRGSIDVCMRPALNDLAGMIACIDNVVAFGPLRETCARVRAGTYDVVIDMLRDYSLASAIVARSSGAVVRIGFTGGGREILFTHPVASAGEPGMDMAALNLRLLEPLGIAAVMKRPVVRLADAAAGLSGRYAVIHPGAHFPSQRWPAERFGQLAARIAHTFGVGVKIVAGPGENVLAQRAAAQGNDSRIETVSPSLHELVRIFAGAALVVCNNSGPLHLASALGVPTLSTMGPTDPVLWGPQSADDTVVRKTTGCSPCSKGACRRQRCLEPVTVDEMFREASRVLGNEGRVPAK